MMPLRIAPERAFFRPGETIRLSAHLDEPVSGPVEATVYHFDQRVAVWSGRASDTPIRLEGQVPAEPGRGYLVRCQAGGQTAWTAFDVLEGWTQAPRYGYLFDFTPERKPRDIAHTLDHLLALHINGLQFYDWQYRHDTLLPPEESFTDPLGRPLSLAVVRALIDAAHQRGMAAMPYTAIYAASPAFAAAHVDWQLFDAKGVPLDFADGFLKLMNPAGPWADHFVRECQRVVAGLPFDGIHVDQYGEPRSGFDAAGSLVDLPAGFAAIIRALRAAMPPEKAVLFNLVHNWPVEALVGSPLDFWYSELWPPVTGLIQLWETIRDNRWLNDRPAVLAVYIAPEWEETVVAAHSAILAAGGSHIAHGDHASYLSDPYFPKAGRPSAALAGRLKQLADFAVAYEEALVFAPDVTDAWADRITLDGERWEPGRLIVHEAGGRLFVNLLAASGRWNEPLPPPAAGALQLAVDGARIRGAWAASPENPLPRRLEDLRLLPFHHWLLIGLELEGDPYDV